MSTATMAPTWPHPVEDPDRVNLRAFFVDQMAMLFVNDPTMPERLAEHMERKTFQEAGWDLGAYCCFAARKVSAAQHVAYRHPIASRLATLNHLLAETLTASQAENVRNRNTITGIHPGLPPNADEIAAKTADLLHAKQELDRTLWSIMDCFGEAGKFSQVFPCDPVAFVRGMAMQDLTDQLLAVQIGATLFDAPKLAQLGRKIAFAYTLTEAKAIEFLGLTTSEPILPAITIAGWLIPEYDHIRGLIAAGTPQVPPKTLLSHPRYLPVIPRTPAAPAPALAPPASSSSPHSSPSQSSRLSMDDAADYIGDLYRWPVAFDPEMEWDRRHQMVPIDLMEDIYRNVRRSPTPNSLRSDPLSSQLGASPPPAPEPQSSPRLRLAAPATMGSPTPSIASEEHMRLVDGYEGAARGMVALANAALQPLAQRACDEDVHVALEEGEILDDEEEGRLGNIMAKVKLVVASEVLAKLDSVIMEMVVGMVHAGSLSNKQIASAVVAMCISHQWSDDE